MKLNKNIADFNNSFSIGERINIPSLNGVSYRTGQATDDVDYDLNTYRRWSEFNLQVEPIFEPESDSEGRVDPSKYEDASNWWNKGNDNIRFKGVKSLFNNSNAVIKSGEARVANNSPLLDSQEIRNRIRERGGCSIRDLVRASENGAMGRAIYNYSDFMYCKYLNKVSNNYLITLRRFPFPCGDHINNVLWDGDINGGNGSGDNTESSNPERQAQAHAPDMGRLVTWMGTPGNDMAEILKYSVLMPYEEMTAKVQEAQGTAESGGLLGSIMNMANPAYASAALKGAAGVSSIGTLQKALGTKVGGFLAAPNNTEWAYHRDMSKPYGPVDVISKTHIRRDGEKGGLDFQQEINLCFDYELRSYDGINTRAAFQDLIGNILTVTYTNGKFWGGTIRSNGAAQSSAFTNLPIFSMNPPLSFNQVKDSVLQSISDVGKAFNNGKDVKSLGDVANMIKNVASNMGSILLGGALNALGRPQKQGMDSLLQNNPVGLWHLTVGNPKHPILSMGNMILTKVEIQQYGPLGLDDFPTGLKVNIGLKHAMPRDKLKIEQMYMMGDQRIYMPMGKDLELMYNNATEYKKNTGDADYDIDAIQAGTGTTENDPKNMTSNGQKDIDANSAATTARAEQSTYMKYFGTNDRTIILMTAKEAHLGSSPAQTAEQAAAEQAKVASSTNSNGEKSTHTSV